MACGLRLAEGGATRDVRKTVTALFCDLVGSTTLAELHDPEVLRPLLHSYFQEMRAAIERHGGVVEKFIGDAVVGLMGIPVAHEDDAIRAVRAAVEMQERLAAINVGAAITLECRIGVTTGEVFVPAGNEPIIGDAMNTASRLQANAAPGWILIGESTWELVRHLAVTEPIGELRLKGKSTPVRAWRLIAFVASSSGDRRDIPTIGRQAELEMLGEAYDEMLTAGSPRRVTVLGAAGIGKSRLIEEFVQRRARTEARILRGRCLSYGEGITYWPLGEIARQIADIEEVDDADTARARLRTFAEGLPEGPTVARGLSAIVGLDERASSDELLWALRRAIEHIARERPVVMIIEDVHWAEPTLLDVIESLATLLEGSPVLVLCEGRSELLGARPAWGATTSSTRAILVAPLNDEDTTELATTLSAGNHQARAMVGQIAMAAEGNPLYVREYVAMLAEGGPTSAGEPDSTLVPPSIHALMSARLDGLPPDERLVAERAAVIGRSFDAAALVALSVPDHGESVRAGLTGLVRRQVVLEEPATHVEQHFRFSHQLVRDAAYERLPKAERARLHERFADYLDETSGDRMAEFEEIVGYHLERAFRYREALAPVDEAGRAVAGRAAERLGASGRRAFERSDITASVNLLSRATSLLDSDDRKRLALLPDLARALDSNGRFDEARSVLEDLVDRSQALDDELNLAYGRVLRCLVFEREVGLEERQRIANESFEVFDRHHDERGLAMCWRLRGAASWRSGWGVGDEGALAKALEHARRAGAHRDEVLIADGLSSSLALGPTPIVDGIRRCEEILAAAPGDRGIEMAMSHALAHLHARLGSIDLARQLAVRCRTIAAESGQRAQAAHLSEVAWDVETLAGDHAAAERIIADGASEFEAMGKRHPMLEAFLALSRSSLGQPTDIEAMRTMAQREQLATRALLEHAIGRALLHAGRTVEAEASASSSVAYFATTDLVTMEADTRIGLCDVLLALDKRDQALAVLRRAEALYEQKGNLVGLAAATERARIIAVAP